MGSVTVEARFTNVSLDQFREELAKLCFAGYGKAALDFKTSSTDYVTAVTLKMFKPVEDPP